MDFHWIVQGITEGLAEMTWLEGVGVFFGIISVFFSIKKNILVELQNAHSF